MEITLGTWNNWSNLNPEIDSNNRGGIVPSESRETKQSPEELHPSKSGTDNEHDQPHWKLALTIGNHP